MLPSFFTFEPALMTEMEQVAQTRTVDAGEILMKPGQPIRFVPIVLSGSIKIMRPADDAGELLLYYLSASDACALSVSSLLTGDSSPILAIVDEKAQLLMIPIEYVDQWMGRYSSWRAFIFQTYQKRFDNLLHTFDQIAFRQLDERLLTYLTQKVRLTGGRHLYITHEDIARDMNTSREVISRLLKQLERVGRVTLARHKISLIADPNTVL